MIMSEPTVREQANILAGRVILFIEEHPEHLGTFISACTDGAQLAIHVAQKRERETDSAMVLTLGLSMKGGGDLMSNPDIRKLLVDGVRRYIETRPTNGRTPMEDQFIRESTVTGEEAS